MTDREVMQQALDALIIANAGLSDIGDADREPGDDLAWCESRAAQALALPRAAIIALNAAIAQPEQTTERNFCTRCGKRLAGDGVHTCTPPKAKK